MKTQKVQIETIKLDPSNPRSITKEAFERLKQSITDFPEMQSVKPLVVADGYALAGNMRLLAYKDLGYRELHVLDVSEWSQAKRDEFMIKDNTHYGSWDYDALANEWDTLPLTEWGVAVWDTEVEDVKGLTDEDDVPQAPQEPITKLGDVWILGEHRVMCGDSTSKEAVEILMDGKKADICFTSPPYALGKSAKLSGNKAMKKSGNAYNQHEDNSKDWLSLMEGFMNAMKEYVTASVVNVQMLAGNKRELLQWMQNTSDNLIDIVIWDKGNSQPAMARGVMSSQFEFIIFLGEENAKRTIPFSDWRGTIKNVYEGPPQRSNKFAEFHGATMPIHLPEWIIKDVCNKALSIYDPFLGTGTTLIAAEKTKRKCYGMELDPKYCDVIVKRWEDFTGKKATREIDDLEVITQAH